MSNADTRERLIDAAQACFSEQGYWGASLRSITERAEANLAAVSYHFGGKEGLLEAVVERSVGAINEERCRRFDALEADDCSELEAWVRALVEPCFVCVDNEGFADFFGLMARLHLESPDQMIPIFERHFAGILARFSAAVGKALPDLDSSRLQMRLQLAGGAFGKCMMLFGHQQTPPVLPIPRPDPAWACEELVAFTIGGLTGTKEVG